MYASVPASPRPRWSGWVSTDWKRARPVPAITSPHLRNRRIVDEGADPLPVPGRYEGPVALGPERREFAVADRLIGILAGTSAARRLRPVPVGLQGTVGRLGVWTGRRAHLTPTLPQSRRSSRHTGSTRTVTLRQRQSGATVQSGASSLTPPLGGSCPDSSPCPPTVRWPRDGCQRRTVRFSVGAPGPGTGRSCSSSPDLCLSSCCRSSVIRLSCPVVVRWPRWRSTSTIRSRPRSGSMFILRPGVRGPQQRCLVLVFSLESLMRR